MNNDKLSNFGYAFQIKVISCLLTDNDFIGQVSDVISPKFFEGEAKEWLVENILEYFNVYKTCPTLEVLKVKLEKASLPTVLETAVVEHLKDAWKYIDSADLDFIKEETIGFCKNQQIKKAIIDSVQLLEKGSYDEIKTLIDNAMKAGADKNIGLDFKKAIKERYTGNVRATKPTPWDVINDITEGGFGKGELVVFVAPAGIGKSWGLINVGAHAVKQGLNVIHYTLELNENYVGLRYDAVITGIANQNLKYNIDEVERKIGNLPGNLIVKYYPTKTASVNTLRAHIDKCILQGIKPDLVIVDYADLLRNATTRKEVRHDLENIYEDLRGMAGEYEVPFYTASQANRSALEEDVIGAEKIAESYAKVMIADFVISLSRKVTDKVAGTGRWHIIKNRFGPDGLTLPSKLNLSNGQIHIFEQTSVQGKEAQKQMNNGEEFVRKSLAQKFKDLQSTNGNHGPAVAKTIDSDSMG